MRRIALVLVLAVLLVSAVFVLGQGNTTTTAPANESGLQITVSHKSCGMVFADSNAATAKATADAQASAAITPEATADAQVSVAATEMMSTANYPRIVLGSDCYDVTPYLNVASNDVLWVALAVPNEPVWEEFEVIPGDENPPRLDKRGRFVGCIIPQMGEQTCRFLWENFGTYYLIEIPVTVRTAYIPPARATTVHTVVSTQQAPAISTPNPSGVWGSCGSCSTCGGPIEQCVLSPDNVCLWDAATCEHPKHSG